MPNRRDFLKTAAFATLGSGIAVSQVLAGECMPSAIHINKYGIGGKMKMTFFPYELKLRHVFTVATYSRTTTPDVVRAKTKECAGLFNILKVKLGRDNDKEMIETIRSVTDLPIAVDANQGWKDRQYALDMIHWLKEKGIVMIEQPMPKEQLDDIAWVTQQSPLPVFADESLQRLGDVAALKGAFTGINIKLMKCTGMREAWKMVTLAHALGMRVMVGCMTETSCAISAASQFSPAVDFADLDGNLLISNDRFKGVEVVNGKITLNDLPGIGVMKI